MPLFFFDVDDGARLIRDDIGMMLANADLAEAEAKRLVLDLAFAEVLKGVPRRFVATVRDESGRVIYRAKATLGIDRPS